MNPPPNVTAHGTTLNVSRLGLDKSFEGVLNGKSTGEMISVLNSTKNAGAYVAVEVFEGLLDGKKGSFALQHYGRFDSAGQSLILEVVPGSGEGELTGVSGTMQIRNEENVHYYDFEFTV